MHIESQKLIPCKNCGFSFSGKYCNNCGEKVYSDKERTVGHFISDGFHVMTHFEGTFFTTVKTLFRRPGKISSDYTFGIRKRYFRLLNLFMILVVVYLLFPMFQGLNQKFYYHEHSDVYGSYAQKKIAAVMKTHHLTHVQVEKAFETKSEKFSKFMLVLLIPLSALAMWPVTFKKRPLAFDQMVFATEINSMFLLWNFLMLPILMVIVQFLYFKFSGNQFDISDGPLLISLGIIPLLLFVLIGSRRFYHFTWVQAVLFTLYFEVIHVIIVQVVYKFILFVTVINQIH